MASFVATNGHPYPVAAVVSAYQDLGFTPSNGRPPGTAVASGTVSAAGALTITGLAEGVKYWLVGLDAEGRWRWTRAYVPNDPELPYPSEIVYGEDLVALEGRMGDLEDGVAAVNLDTTGSVPSSPRTILFTPAAAGEAWRVGGDDESGLQGGEGLITQIYSKGAVELRARRTADAPTPGASGAGTPHLHVIGTTTSVPVLRVSPVVGSTASTFQIQDNLGDIRLAVSATGRVAIGSSATGSNCHLQIGEWTGNFNGNGQMGIRVQLDTGTSGEGDGNALDAVQFLVNVIDGTGQGNIRAVDAHVDLNDDEVFSESEGEGAFNYYGTIQVNSSSSRKAIQAYQQVKIGQQETINTVDYQNAAAGMILGVTNFGVSDNEGYVQKIVSSGNRKVSAGLIFTAAGNPNGVDGDSNPIDSGHALKTNLVMKDDTIQAGAVDFGPDLYFMWCGPYDTDTYADGVGGTPKFAIDRLGQVGIGVAPTTYGLDVVGDVRFGNADGSAVLDLQQTDEAFPRWTFDLDGEAHIGDGSNAQDVHYGRTGSAQFGTKTGTQFSIGQAAHSGNGFLQMWEQTSAPATPPANAAREYYEDNGSGKTRKVIKWPSGATTVVATEP